MANYNRRCFGILPPKANSDSQLGLTAKLNCDPTTRVTTTIKSATVSPPTNVLVEDWGPNGITMYVQ
jgi:hypothetical protein